MTTSTAQQLANDAVSNLQGSYTTALPIIVPAIIVVFVLFGGIAWLKRLWHKRV